MIKKRITIKSEDIEWKLVTDHAMTEQEILDIKKNLPMFDINILSFDIKQYTNDSKTRIESEGDYVTYAQIAQEIRYMGYDIDNEWIYSNNNKIGQYNYFGKWLRLSKKLTEYPEAIIWSFPRYFTVWFNGYYTKVKDIRKQCLTDDYTINMNLFNKGD